MLGPGPRPENRRAETPTPPTAQSRVDWIGGTGFGFEIRTEADADLARRDHGIRRAQSEQPDQAMRAGLRASVAGLAAAARQPTREEMEEAARSALEALGMGNAKAIFVAHNDEDYAHVHIVASKINPATGRAYDLASKLAHALDMGARATSASMAASSARAAKTRTNCARAIADARRRRPCWRR